MGKELPHLGHYSVRTLPCAMFYGSTNYHVHSIDGVDHNVCKKEDANKTGAWGTYSMLSLFNRLNYT